MKSEPESTTKFGDWLWKPTPASQLMVAVGGFIAGLGSYHLFLRQLKRLKTASHIPPEWITEQRILKGQVELMLDAGVDNIYR